MGASNGRSYLLYLCQMLTFSGVSFSYGAHSIVDRLNFSIPAGANLSLIGESGCGKSTLLKLMYGSLQPDAGQISVDGEAVPNPSNSLLPGMPGVRYLAQDFGLMPFATVAENVGRDLSNTNKAAKRRRVLEMLELVDIAGLESKKPHVISGGQQQRAALAMALASGPRMLLLDEPFSQIDAFHTAGLRRRIFNHCRENAITCVVATHDAEDVLSFASQVLVMRSGLSPNMFTPKDLFGNPPDLYAASLLGDVSSLPPNFAGLGNPQPLILYPHQMHIGEGPIAASVRHSYFRGADYLIEAEAYGVTLFISHPLAIPSGTAIRISV